MQSGVMSRYLRKGRERERERERERGVVKEESVCE